MFSGVPIGMHGKGTCTFSFVAVVNVRLITGVKTLRKVSCTQWSLERRVWVVQAFTRLQIYLHCRVSFF